MLYANNPIKLSPDDTHDRRLHQRHSVENIAALMSFDGLLYIPGKVKDVSHNGMYIETNSRLMLLSDDIPLFLNMDGILRSAEIDIVRIDPKGIGIWIDRSHSKNHWMLSSLLPRT